MFRPTFVSVLSCWLLALSFSCFGQVDAGSILGTVRDSSGAVILTRK
jgi:hypothetical protein